MAVLLVSCSSSSRGESTSLTASLSGSSSDVSLVALDVVVLPGLSLKKQAEDANASLVSTFPEGFTFSDNYVPHVSLLQMFAEKDQVTKVGEVVQKTLEESKTSTKDLTLSSTGIQRGGPIPDSEPSIYAPKLVIAPSSGLSDLQDALVTALKPYMRTGGTETAFLVNDEDKEAAAKLGLSVILPLGIKLVDKYVSSETGSKLAPHITLGLANDAAWAKLSTESFILRRAKSTVVAVCLLGPYDSCHQIKWEFPLR